MVVCKPKMKGQLSLKRGKGASRETSDGTYPLNFPKTSFNRFALKDPDFSVNRMARQLGLY